MILPCSHFDPAPTKGCQLGRPMSGVYCLRQCPAYSECGYDKALMDEWIKMVAKPEAMPCESP